jgi:hypothetical protein
MDDARLRCKEVEPEHLTQYLVGEWERSRLGCFADMMNEIWKDFAKETHWCASNISMGRAGTAYTLSYCLALLGEVYRWTPGSLPALPVGVFSFYIPPFAVSSERKSVCLFSASHRSA